MPACRGNLKAYPRVGHYFRRSAGWLSGAAAFVSASVTGSALARPPAHDPAAVDACDLRACWAALSLMLAAGLAVGGVASAALLAGGGGHEGVAAAALRGASRAAMGLYCYWVALEAAAPYVVPCGGG